MIVALVLFLLWIVTLRYIEGRQIKKYMQMIGKPEKEITLQEATNEAGRLFSIIDDTEMERHPKDFLRVHEGKEFKLYIEEVRRNIYVFGLLVYAAHNLGCEIVLRRISEEDIEDEYNRANFEKYLSDEISRFFEDWEIEFTAMNKYK